MSLTPPREPAYLVWLPVDGCDNIDYTQDARRHAPSACYRNHSTRKRIKEPYEEPHQRRLDQGREDYRVVARAMTSVSQVSSSGRTMDPSMRPRMRPTAVGAVQSSLESIVVRGVCR